MYMFCFCIACVREYIYICLAGHMGLALDSAYIARHGNYVRGGRASLNAKAASFHEDMKIPKKIKNRKTSKTT